MFFDALTIAAARDELRASLLPGRVQQVRAVGPLAISLEIYGAHRRRYLLLSAHAEYARAHLLAAAPTRDPAIHSPLLLLLRKYLRGAILQTIEQPQFERVLDLGFTKVLPVQKHGPPTLDELEAEDEGEDDLPLDDRRAEIPPGFALYETHLVAEIMGRHSNLVLVGADGLVLDAVKHIPASINRYRTTLPHQPYVPPPPQRKLDFLGLGERSFAGELGELDPQAFLWQTLVARFRAVSPLLAREAVYRATGSADTRVAAAEVPPLYAALTAILGLARSAAWQPSLAWEPGAERVALAFAPYPLQHLAAGGAVLEAAASISAAADAFYTAVEAVGGHTQLKTAVRAELGALRHRLERRRSALQAELDRAVGFEQERHKGELILAYMYGLAPGQTRLEIPEENLVILLDPRRTPLEQAQAMFREYQRARAAVEGVPARLAAVELGLRYLDELATHLDLAEDHDTIQLLRGELAALPDEIGTHVAAPAAPPPARRPPARPHGARRKPAPATPAAPRESRLATTPAKVVSQDGFTLFYGRSARQNDALTFGLARPDDLWLHARNVPGAHVLIRTDQRPVPESTLAEAARLAARHSQARDDTAVDVILTEKRHVRRVAGAPPGLVTVSHERVLRVRPQPAEPDAPGG
ncbi:MAG TPA: NFACT RNA binding domain-containing protein [Chloroflexia bacterium]|nr:NFACT RNA binding domain-containing protein [Chloroflexia bacterium]